MNEIYIEKYELVGLSIKISGSLNKELVGLSGKVILETKNMIIIETENGRKSIPKSLCKFETNDGKILIDGEKLVKRSHERLESYIWLEI